MLACNWRLQRLFAFELRRRSRRSGQSVPRLHQILRPRAKLGRADETDIAGRAAKCAATGAFAAKVDDAPSARETPQPQGRARKATGRRRRAAANYEATWANSSLARALRR